MREPPRRGGSPACVRQAGAGGVTVEGSRFNSWALNEFDPNHGENYL
jgi:hypothetical protein